MSRRNWAGLRGVGDARAHKSKGFPPLLVGEKFQPTDLISQLLFKCCSIIVIVVVACSVWFLLAFVMLWMRYAVPNNFRLHVGLTI